MSADTPTDEHRSHVTIVFCDVSNSSGLARELEPEDYSDLLSDLRRHAKSIVSKFGGEIIRIDGDGFIFLFGYPDAHSNASERAIEATLSLHETADRMSQDASLTSEPLQLHSGIHSGVTLIREGDVTVGRYEILGNPTNITSRLCEYAKPGEIIVSEAALGNNRDKYDCSDRKNVKLRGQKDKVAVRKLLKRKKTQETPSAYSAFKGRERELNWVLEVLGNPSGATGPAFIVGEAGMGKSRLIREVLTEARSHKPLTFIATCEAILDGQPLVPIRKLLLQFLAISDALDLTRDPQTEDPRSAPSSPLNRLLAEDASQISKHELSELADAMLALFAHRAPDAGLNLIIDDWHWVDELTETTIDLLIRRKQDLNLNIVISSRQDPDPMFGGDEKTILRLAPLDEGSVRALMSDLVELLDPNMAAKIALLSEGNPLYVSELCHAANQGGQALEVTDDTSWLHALTNARFQNLTEDQAKIVKAAAVIGFDVSYDLLQEVSGVKLDREILDQLQSADFLFASEDSGGLKFKHGLTRNAIYSLIGLRERRALHHKVIEIRERLLPAEQRDDGFNQLAYHYSGANLPEKALENAILAGDKALNSAALDRAQQFYAFAMEEYKKIKEPEFGIDRVLFKYGLASIVDPGKDQDVVISDIQAWADRNDQPMASAWAQYWRAFVYYGIGRSNDALREFLAARDAAHRVGDQNLVSRITGTLGQVYGSIADYKLAIPALEHSIDIQLKRYRTSNNPTAVAYSAASLGFVLADQGNFELANRRFEEAIELIAGKEHQTELSVRAYHGAALMWQGQYEQAIENWHWIIEHSSRMRSRYFMAKSKALLGVTEFLSEGSAEALEPVCKIADSMHLASQQRLSLEHGYLAECFTQLEDWDRAKKYAVKSIQRSRLGDHLGNAQAYRTLTRLSLEGHARKSADHYAKRAIDVADARGSTREQAINERTFKQLFAQNPSALSAVV
ncbi:MAG: adenylate/guanylate cyclase domain-containing protein [Pseudomonadota bacterium]